MPRIQLIISKACNFPYSLSRDFVGIIWVHPLVIASWFIDAFSFDNIKKNSRNYAKRQYTFFNNQFSNLKWFNTNYSDFNETFLEVCTYLESN